MSAGCKPAAELLSVRLCATHLPVNFALTVCPVYGVCACRFKELRDYVLSRRDALGGGPSKEPSIMNLDLDDAEALKKSGKGFA